MTTHDVFRLAARRQEVAEQLASHADDRRQLRRAEATDPPEHADGRGSLAGSSQRFRQNQATPSRNERFVAGSGRRDRDRHVALHGSQVADGEVREGGASRCLCDELCIGGSLRVDQPLSPETARRNRRPTAIATSGRRPHRLPIGIPLAGHRLQRRSALVVRAPEVGPRQLRRAARLASSPRERGPRPLRSVVSAWSSRASLTSRP